MARADRGEYDLLNLPPRSIYSAWHYQCHITFMLAKKKHLYSPTSGFVCNVNVYNRDLLPGQLTLQ